MGLTAYRKYQELLGRGHYPPRMGFKCKAGDINEFANRVRLARSFLGLNLEGYTDETVAGYNAFLKIFLTHSAFERFLKIFGVDIDQVGRMFTSEAGVIIGELIELDQTRRLYEYLYPRLNAKLQIKLEQIYAGDESNIAYLSASIRHIFAHGHLTAHANGIRSNSMNRWCNHLSDYLIEIMDSEFSKKINEYQQRLADRSNA